MVQGMEWVWRRNGNANLTTIIPNLELKWIIPNCSDHLASSGFISFHDDAITCVPILDPYVGAASFA